MRGIQGERDPISVLREYQVGLSLGPVAELLELNDRDITKVLKGIPDNDMYTMIYWSKWGYYV